MWTEKLYNDHMSCITMLMFLPTHAHSAAGRLPRAPLPPGRFRTFKGITPKCGKCLTCERPKMKKACVVNRERLAQGLEPEFRTAEARKKHDMKTLRIKEEVE